MMKITILPDMPYGDTVGITNEIISVLSQTDTVLYLCESTKPYIRNTKSVHFGTYEAVLKACDLMIAVGGDGTVTKYAADAALHRKPILGINGGHLGFLSGLEKGETHLLLNLMNGDYKIKNRMLLQATVFDEKGEQISSGYCINDAVISRGANLRMVDLSVELDGKLLATHRADGIIVATPTGSTAYSMSAGGPVVDPHMECIIVTPICSHSLTARSVVCSSESTLVIRNASDAGDVREMSVTTDSREPVPVPYGGRVEIKKAEIAVQFITIKRQSFYEILQEKMIERNNGL